MTLENKHLERRDFMRMDVRTRIKFKVVGQDGTFDGESNDLSGAGISFTTPQRVDQGVMLEVSVLPETDKLTPLVATVTVTRVQPWEDNQFLVAGEIATVK